MNVVKNSPDQRTVSHNSAVFPTSVTVFCNSVIDVVDYHDVCVPHLHRLFGEAEAIARVVADSCVGILITLAK
jgi:hypothetical protein